VYLFTKTSGSSPEEISLNIDGVERQDKMGDEIDYTTIVEMAVDVKKGA
jgi:hypothetical protein